MIPTLFPFKVSPPEKLTFISASSSLNFSNIHSQTFCYFTYTISLLYISLVTLFSTIFSFSCFLTSAFILFSNSTTTSFTFSRSSSLFQLSCSAINPFHYTKYFTIPLTFLLFNIFSTFHSLTLFTSTSFTSSALYSLTYFLYHTTQLTFITR